MEVGDRVYKKGESLYFTNLYGKNISNGTPGTIKRIKRRYENTPNFYILYCIHFDGYEYNNELLDQYESSSLKMSEPGEPKIF